LFINSLIIFLFTAIFYIKPFKFKNLLPLSHKSGIVFRHLMVWGVVGQNHIHAS